MKRSRAIIAVVLIIFSSNSFCQSIIRSSIGSIGTTFYSEGIILKQTIGQSSPTTKLITGNATLRQGFQQPVTNQITDESLPQISFSIYPNPATLEFRILLSEEFSEYDLNISQLTGKIFYNEERIKVIDHRINIDGFLPGVYIIQIKAENRVGMKKLVIL